MISREKALEWAKEAGFETVWMTEMTDLLNRAYQEGQRDMRERAAKQCEDSSIEGLPDEPTEGAFVQIACGIVFSKEIRLLEIE